jgi:hypothetical protein
VREESSDAIEALISRSRDKSAKAATKVNSGGENERRSCYQLSSKMPRIADPGVPEIY